VNTRLIPSLSALKAFEATARLASFARAADELNVSKSAISHQVRLLEEGFGVRLLQRGRIAPTAEGAILLQAVVQSLATLGEACERLALGGTTRRRKLTVTANAPFSAFWLAPRIARFSALQPEVDITLQVMDGVPDWSEDRVDLAILRTREGAPNDVGGPAHADDIFLLGETVFPVCSPTLAIGEARDLVAHRLIQEEHLASPEVDWSTWFSLMHLGPVPPGRLVRFSGFSLAISAAIAGAGVALGRSPLIDDELTSGRLVRLFGEKQIAGSWRFVMRPRPGRTAPMIPALCEFLRREAAGISA
jgi:LysR family glycine cleavage system transcriptional activator